VPKKIQEIEESKEKLYHSEFKTFIDGQDWENRQKKLIPQNDLGSVIDPRESGLNTRMARLAGMHNRHARSIQDSEKNQILNRYNYLSTQFHWLEEYLPRNKLDQILQLMAYSRTQRKIAKELAGLNIRDLALILAFWELDVYPLGNYIVEEVLQDINDYLRSYSNNFMIRGVLSIKDIQLAQELILSDLYALEFHQKTKTFSKIPAEALRYYRALLHTFEKDVPVEFARKIEKARSIRPDLKIPASVYIWVIRKKLLQAMLPFLIMKIKIKNISLDELQKYTENFWNNVFHQKAVGDLPTIGFLLIETWQKANNRQLPIRLTALHKVEKFKTRIKAYRRRFSDLMIKSLPKHLRSKPITKAQKRVEQKLQEEKQKTRRIQSLIAQIELIKKWLNQFSTLESQKLLDRSENLKNTYEENQRVMVSLQQELNTLQEKGSKSRLISEEEKLQEYKALQMLLFESFFEIIDINQTLMNNSFSDSTGIKKLMKLEETILPILQIQIQTYKDQFSLTKTSGEYKIEAQNCQKLIKQVQLNFEKLVGVIKQKIEDHIKFHLVNDPLQTISESFS
jgi:hypothetical protein